MEDSLRGAWAASYDAWIDVPGCSGVIYNRPGNVSQGILEYPTSVLTSCMFAVMAHNPMGVRASDDDNDRAHAQLTARIDALTLPQGGWIAPFFGFSDDWREPGFVLACPSFDANAIAQTREYAVELAKEFVQGAIYEYHPIEGQRCALLRKTVHVVMSSGVNSEVILVQTPRPATPYSNPH
ncbi:hypothetical protein THRCLA_23361 [Thraustotheca clavata]|uniref:DUF3293 domain-containing protein n=1 Tax=Thraustotheca clavata TaxID=74557 RepID=A0A1V9Y6Y2_9STRA|nr:hypothetical protein THRCLA_23361 [Thraustotheca clavata]